MSFCTACGTKNNDGFTFCVNCGAKLQSNVAPAQPVQPQPMYTPPVQTQQVYTQQVYSQPANSTTQPQQFMGGPSRSCLVFGILSVVFCGICLSYIFGPIAIAKATKEIKKFGKQGYATAAIVLSIIGLVITSAQVFIILISSLG